jgi:hypothetical protein
MFDIVPLLDGCPTAVRQFFDELPLRQTVFSVLSNTRATSFEVAE